MCEWIEDLGPDPDSSPTTSPAPQRASAKRVSLARPCDGAVPSSRSVPDVAALRRLRPGTATDLHQLAGQHLGLDNATIEQEALKLLGPAPAGGRTKTQVLRLWNQLVTRRAVDEPARAI